MPSLVSPKYFFPYKYEEITYNDKWFCCSKNSWLSPNKQFVTKIAVAVKKILNSAEARTLLTAADCPPPLLTDSANFRFLLDKL